MPDSTAENLQGKPADGGLQEAEASIEPKHRFDPGKPDCFGPVINMTDDEVTTLILDTGRRLDRAGEYDQGDVMAMEWDTLRDLHTVAEKLWVHRLNGGGGDS